MDLRQLLGALESSNLTTSTNGTIDLSTILTSVPSTVLEVFIPGYGLLSRVMLNAIGLDITLFVCAAVIFFGLIQAGRYMSNRVASFFSSWFMSEVRVEEGDELFDQFIDWVVATQHRSTRRSAHARTYHYMYSRNEAANAIAETQFESALFNNVTFAAKRAPEFRPGYGSQRFWWKGCLFSWSRYKGEIGNSQDWRRGRPNELIFIRCIGRSIDPIKNLLVTVKEWGLSQAVGQTRVKHPATNERRHWSPWQSGQLRPSRSIDTVVLDPLEKARVIKDLNEYLHPASEKWYASRGMPYRRGLLFHGAPGTGKSSLSFALASLFGLDIYVMCLNEGSLTEADLMELFNRLPRRCIVLMEDIDAVGISRQDDEGKKLKEKVEDTLKAIEDKKEEPVKPKIEKKKKARKDSKQDGTTEANSSGEHKRSTSNGVSEQNGSAGVNGTAAHANGVKDKKTKKGKKSKAAKKADSEFTLRDLANELKSLTAAPSSVVVAGRSRRAKPEVTVVDPETGKPTNSKISLSGLLNAIDGVASQEGRILIMTTNHPEKLDPALTRPGRVDRKVEFRLASRGQARELFVRMYASRDQVPETEISVAGGVVTARYAGAPRAKTAGPPDATAITIAAAEAAPYTEAELDALAQDYAALIPEDKFSPAELQNHLMDYKRSPRTAVEKAPAWVAKMLKEKEDALKKETEKEEEKKKKEEEEKEKDKKAEESAEGEDESEDGSDDDSESDSDNDSDEE